MSGNDSYQNTSNMVAALNKLSLQTLSASMPNLVAAVFIGFVSGISNMVTLAVIATHKTLKTKCFALMANADFLIGGAYFASCIRKLILMVTQTPETGSQLHCLGALSIHFFSQAASIDLAVVISVDRFTAIVLPLRYKVLRYSYTGLLLLIAWGHACVMVGFYFYQASDSILFASCNLALIMTVDFYNYQNVQNIVLAALTIVIYVVVLSVMTLKIRTARRQKLNLVETAKSFEREVTITLSAVMFSYLSTILISTIGLAAIANLEASKKTVIGPIIRLLPIADSGINFWIYLWRSKDFRAGFKDTFRKSELRNSFYTSIQPVPTMYNTLLWFKLFVNVTWFAVN